MQPIAAVREVPLVDLLAPQRFHLIESRAAQRTFEVVRPKVSMEGSTHQSKTTALPSAIEARKPRVRSNAARVRYGVTPS
jgi:hypothetical protein